ncbi:Casein kinase I -like protein 2 [Sarcoptes scabiei]|uniref:Casein kinase I -like protein 2 n=1 Tax=Sarcoptes scabiei TaxID=52283 RepID=A0A834V9M8_SARSC|nr:Casein kinase I -like protein 2 [Sarcoptes scabiei]
MDETNLATNQQTTILGGLKDFILEGSEIKDSPYQLIGRSSIAAGSFGQVYLTRNTKTNELVATKLVRKDNPNAKLKQEYEWYRILGPMPGISKVFFFGECGPYNAMCSNHHTDCYYDLGDNALCTFEKDNLLQCETRKFCLGRPNTPQANQIYMIGLINAKWFETSDSRHIPKNPGLTIISSSSNENATNGEKFLIEPKRFGVYGTPRYMSLNAHKGKELSRRDDLESIGYMLIYFIHGKLPWQGMPTNGQGYEHIYATKKMIQLDQLCANLPPEYYHYMLYVRTLKFAQEPTIAI